MTVAEEFAAALEDVEPVDDAAATAEVLLPAWRSALAANDLVVVLSPWRRLLGSLVLPFHLYLTKPAELGSLGLHPNPLIAPLRFADLEWLKEPRYDAAHARELRKPIRLALADSASSSRRRTDWESAVVNRPERIPYRLPAISFQSLGILSRDGSLRRVPRPVIGRHASRRLRKDSVVAAKAGRLTRQMSALAATCDSIFINVQGVRGPRSLDLVRSLIDANKGKPGLLVAAAPSELFDLAGTNSWPTFPRVTAVGIPVEPFELRIQTVARDRQQIERTFSAATEGLEGYSSVSAWLYELARTAWWAAVRSVGTDETRERSVRNYLRAISGAESTHPMEAGGFAAFTKSLLDLLHDSTRAEERRTAVVEAVESGYRTIVVANADTRAELLRLEPHLAIDEIRCLTTYEAWRVTDTDHAVVLGIAGASSIDSLLALRPKSGVAVADPIEARVAASLLMRWNSWLHNAGIAQGAADALGARFNAVAPLNDGTSVVDIALGEAIAPPSSRAQLLSSYRRDGEPAIRVRFVNGEELVCGRTRQFDVVAEGSYQLHSKLATELEAGDEVIVVASDDAQGFSEKLIEALDAGRLRDAAQQRRALLRVISAAAKAHSLGPAQIARSLGPRGVKVSSAAIAGWLRGTHEDATVANTRHSLSALLSVLKVDIDDETLDVYWRAARTVRIGHRLAGRQVVRAIRAAAAGRLSPRTMASIEHDYGLNARQLVQAAHALVVDDVDELT